MLTAEELRGMPTLSTSQADDLKIETDRTRIWLSRCGIEDGEKFDNKITIEMIVDGNWETVMEYAG